MQNETKWKSFQKHPQGNNAQKEEHTCAEPSGGGNSTLYKAHPCFLLFLPLRISMHLNEWEEVEWARGILIVDFQKFYAK